MHTPCLMGMASGRRRIIEDHCLLDKLDDKLRGNFLRNVREMILSTDMMFHASLCADLKGILGEGTQQDTDEHAASKYNEETRLVLSKLVVHAADLSGQGMAREQAELWTDRLLEEFSAQVKREVEERLEVTAFMTNLHNPITKAKVQQGFLNNIVLPYATDMHHREMKHVTKKRMTRIFEVTEDMSWTFGRPS
ncbi:hypothetical protein CYMTET_34717 [Cymbomonas tetramitiformis]|uniref:PDEase domain-containing protein n=1 Tax=Cymbomonas tetramitiformis TaxID=36881 RepID=A0AAE0FAH4_9CHLO|nr:hypothetical protein CYMTET_34717 [Cymbomonas tetramitiformis]